MIVGIGVEEVNSVIESHVQREGRCFVGHHALMSQHRYPTTLLPCSIYEGTHVCQIQRQIYLSLLESI